ncbi:MAG: AsmA family protein [Proteobacteria bacterium]|nr:AsmA family protein [Pseudomonadota bacterium]
MNGNEAKDKIAQWRADVERRWVNARARLAIWREQRRERRRAQRGRRKHRNPSAGFWIATILGGAIIAASLALAAISGNALRQPITYWLSARLGRQVQIAGDLHLRVLSIQPSISADGVTIANTDWAGGGQMAAVRHLHVEAKFWPLLHGRLVLPVVEIVSPNVVVVRDKSGRSNWQFATTSGGSSSLPPIRRFLIDDGHLRVVDAKRGLTFVGTVNSRENGRDANNAFELLGDGRLNRAAFRAEIHGGPLIHVDETKPYEFRGNVSAGATHVIARGKIIHPFDLKDFEASVIFSGPDLADLYYLTGLALPNTPPYRVKGHLTRDGQRYRFERLAGTVGGSDLKGDLYVDASGERTFLSGKLHSRTLDFDDLGPLFGAPPAIGKHGTASVAQEAKAQAVAVKEAGSAPMVLPDAPLQIERVRQMDANVSYEAETIKSRDFPLRSLQVRATLDHGVLGLSPIKVVFAHGTIAGKARIDARNDVPASDVDVRFTDLTLEQFFPGKDKPLEGTLEARVKVHALGNSIHKAASTATGTVTAVVPHGEMRKAFAELMGVNVTKGLVPLLFGDKSQTEIRCGVAHFEAKDGVLKVQNFVFDTDVVRAEGSGKVDLRNERLDLALKGEPKSLELLRLRTPITVKGPLVKPEVGIDASNAVAQGGLAVAAGVLLSPIAALLPFVNPGLADDANCSALLAEAKDEGVRVKTRRG